jgi:hypothetical protein
MALDSSGGKGYEPEGKMSIKTTVDLKVFAMHKNPLYACHD